MAKKIEITEKQRQQFNYMLTTLKKISKDYMTPAQIRTKSPDMYGLDGEEAMEMSYENIQADAKLASKGVREIVHNN